MAAHAQLVPEPPSALSIKSSGQPRRGGIRRRTLLLVGPLLFLIFCQPFTTPTDPDYWWHVRTGQFIFETRTIPRVDIFSYTALGQPWVTHEWGSELLFYVVSHPFGYVGLVGLFGIFEALTALAVYLMCRRRGLGEPAAAIAMMVAFSMSITNATVRPQVLTAFLLALTALLLTRYRQGNGRALLLLPIIFVVWVNLHGGYVIGLALLGMTVVGDLIAQKVGQATPPMRRLVVATGLSALATLVNPHGLQAWTYPFTFLGPSNPVMGLITEWQSPNFHDLLFLPFAISLLATIVVGAGRYPLDVSETLWAIGFSLLGLEGVRHVPLYAVVVVPLLAARARVELPALSYSLQAWRRTFLLAVAGVAIVFVAVIPLFSPVRRDRLQLGREPNANGFPVGAIEYLATHDLTGNMFNEYDWGGYVIDRLYPRHKVFIDSRPDMYGVNLTEEYLEVAGLRSGWQRVLAAHQIAVVLVRKESPLAAALAASPDWETVYRGPVSEILVRRS